MENLPQTEPASRKHATWLRGKVPPSPPALYAVWMVTLASLFGGCSYYNAGDGHSGSPCQTALDCDDGNLCTVDTCQSNRCANLPDTGTTCSSQDSCRVGICDAAGECAQLVALGELCDDGDPCTANDICNESGLCGGQIDAAVGRACEDGNPCTIDTSCDSKGSCSGGGPAALGASCEQNDPCTSENVCLEDGSCSDGIPLSLTDSTCEVCSCNSLWGISCEYPKTIECPCNLWGDVTFVDSFPDLKIQYVDSFPDLEITLSEDKPTASGQWREVSSFPDFTVQVVNSFPDLTIRLTDKPDNGCAD